MSHVRGVTGIPLTYVIRAVLFPPHESDNPAFGEQESAYTSIDSELMSRAPILDAQCDLMDDKDELEEIGPFALTFLTDAKKVWAIGKWLFCSAGSLFCNLSCQLLVTFCQFVWGRTFW